MKETHAKGGKIEKNMKKQSILNLVNSILLLCTLLFSVISFAWYTPNKDIKPPISFTAGGAGNLSNLTQILFDDAGAKRDVTTMTPGYFGTNGIPAAYTETLLEFGTIDDLGYLKNSNCVFYCLEIDKTLGTTVELNVSYTTSGLDTTLGKHFNIYEAGADGESNALLTTDTVNGVEDVDIHATAAGYENFEATTEDPEIHTFINYKSAISTTPPESITTFSEMTALFANDTEPTMISAVDNTSEKEELTAPALSDSQQNYYLYIMLYPNLSNYDELAMLLLDHMPFQIAFGLKLYVGVHRDN